MDETPQNIISDDVSGSVILIKCKDCCGNQTRLCTCATHEHIRNHQEDTLLIIPTQPHDSYT